MRFPWTVCLLGLLSCAGLRAGEAPSPAASPWRFATTARATHDSNVFLQDGGALKAGQTVAGTPARAHDLTGVFGAELGWSRKTGAGTLTAAYTPELYRYNNYTSENHDDHRLRAGLAGADGAWSWDATANIFVVDGSELGPVYNRVGGGPALAGEPVRSRRDQTVSKGAARLTYAGEHGWTRVLASAVYQDFHTQFAAGCAAYVDRGEATAGFEAGRDVRPGFALVGGVRAGRQFQADLSGAPGANGTNDIVRVLAGFEGKPVKTLKLDVRVGPDFRHFGPDEPAALDHSRTSPYGEVAATWSPTAADSVALTGKYWLWLCSSGRGAYEDSSWELTWKHRCTERLGGRMAARLATGDSKGYNYPGAAAFRDVIFGATLGADYRLAKNLTLDASVVCDQGESQIPNRPGREYLRVQAGLALTATW